MSEVTVWAPVVLLAWACVHDLRTREIPYWIPGVMVAWAVGATAMGWSGLSWVEVIGGLMLGLGLGWGLVFLGVLMFGTGGEADVEPEEGDEEEDEEGAGVAFGGGDANLIGGVGASVGLSSVLPVFAAIAIMGGVVALVAAARGRRDFAYAPAIALGVVVFVAYQELTAHAA